MYNTMDEVPDDNTLWSRPGVLFYSAHLVIILGLLYLKKLPGNSLVMRMCFMGGYSILAYWARARLCQLDVFLWYSLLAGANGVMIVAGLYAFLTRLFQQPLPDYAELYFQLFAPLKMTVKEFNSLLSISNGIKKIEATDLYAAEGQRGSGNDLSVLLTGRLTATHRDVPLHCIEACQFIDSTEWEAYESGKFKTYGVTIAADVNSTFVSWQREKLVYYLSQREYVNNILNLVLGRDIAFKLYSANSATSNSADKPTQIAANMSSASSSANISHGTPPSMPQVTSAGSNSQSTTFGGAPNLQSSAGGHNPQSSAGGHNPQSTAGGHNPQSSAGGHNPQSTAGGHNPQSPQSSAGGHNPQSSAGGHNPQSSAGGQNPQSTAGGHNPQSTAGGHNPQSTAGGHNLQSTEGGNNPQSTPGGPNPQSTAGGHNPQSTAGRNNPQSSAGGPTPQSTVEGPDVHATPDRSNLNSTMGAANPQLIESTPSSENGGAIPNLHLVGTTLHQSNTPEAIQTMPGAKMVARQKATECVEESAKRFNSSWESKPWQEQ